ncbi:transposase [Pontibacter qinzhouensis]|uniref:Transposase n=1 Tax=Pontibacter qinzhouensis TaxID=2603253 RepID=A0A5C8KAT0_9BACT|nr:transposase [Pontibacter qinzhouensis]TXK49029.1 transposase [Pontibacter qinzhouensis]
MSHQYKIRNEEAVYFLTCTVVDWIDVFTRASYKKEIVQSLQFCQEKKGLLLYAWCLMPSHLHLIASAADGAKLAAIIRDFKKYTSRTIVKLIEQEPESRRNWMLQRFLYAGKYLQRVENYKFWQDGYHAIELTSNFMKEQKLDYLHQNPVTDLTVAAPEHYVFSSASNYAGNGGLLQVLLL